MEKMTKKEMKAMEGGVGFLSCLAELVFHMDIIIDKHYPMYGVRSLYMTCLQMHPLDY